MYLSFLRLSSNIIKRPIRPIAKNIFPPITPIMLLIVAGLSSATVVYTLGQRVAFAASFITMKLSGCLKATSVNALKFVNNETNNADVMRNITKTNMRSFFSAYSLLTDLYHWDQIFTATR